MPSTAIRGLLAGLTAATLLTLGACAVPASEASSVAGPGSGQTESAKPLDVPADEPSATDEPSASDDSSADDESQYSFGDTVTYEDGLEVTVSKPRRYSPTEGAAIGKGDKSFVVMTVTVKNGTDSRWDPSDFYTTAQTGDRDAEEVYDDNVGGSPDTKVLRGGKLKFDVAYGVENGQPFVLEMSPGDDYVDSLFVS